MNAIATRLIPRLIVIQFLVGASAELILIAFAPRLLLLDARIVMGTLPTALWAGLAMTAFEILTTLLLTRRLRPALRAMAAGSDAVEAADLIVLNALPLRIVLLDLGGTLLSAAVSVVPPLRPSTNDLYTQGALVVLSMTIVSAAALPLYVMLRASVARVLELAPTRSAREALAMMDLVRPKDARAVPRRTVAFVRQRLVAAVAAPVAFVALGASLLVYAHARAFDTVAREEQARALASGPLELAAGDAAGRSEAIQAAAAHGFEVRFEPAAAPFATVHDEAGKTTLTVPLESGHALVRFETTRLSSVTYVYVLLALVATALATLLGSRLGQWFAADVALATRAVRETGAADVVRGTRVRREARFTQLGSLMDAIDELGGVFREFASAQETAIDVRAAAERLRGLFFASMSHDLKGPLNAILGFAELVSRNRLTDGQRESLAIIEQRGRELLILIQTILDSARVEAGALTVSLEWTMLGDVVMSAVLDARDLAVGTGVDVVGEIQPGVPKLYIDGERIVQALTAVITSAVRFTEKGVVRVRATLPESSERLRIDVESSGRTVPTGEISKVFEAFKDPDRARRHGSLGLGLSLARSIVELHAGSIDVDASPGGGVVFRVWLPTSAERVAVRAGRMGAAAG